VKDKRTWTFIVVGVLVALVFAVVVSQLASSDPDGLEYVAEQEGFIETAEDHTFGDAPLADYGANLGATDRVNTAVAGAVGVAITLAVGWGLFRLVARGRDDRTSTPTPGQG
jgi:PDGLE domain